MTDNQGNTGLDFLDELATPSQTSRNEPTPVADSLSATQTTENAGPDTSVPAAPETPQNEADKPKFPNIVNTLPEGSEVPEGYSTISDWSRLLTVRNVMEKGLGADGVVDKNAVYAATKAARHPLPVLLIGDNVYLGPEAVEAWDARPVRGEGSGSTGGQLSDDDLLKAAARSRENVTFLQGRLTSISERLNKAKALQDKRDKQLKARNLDWDKVDTWVSDHEEEIPDEADSAKAA